MRRFVLFFLPIWILAAPAALSAAEATPDAKPVNSVIEYEQSVDYSCEKDTDCEIKDVGNCCGSQPKCVNKAAQVDSLLLQELCKKERIDAACGFTGINACVCVKQRCTGKYIARTSEEDDSAKQ